MEQTKAQLAAELVLVPEKHEDRTIYKNSLMAWLTNLLDSTAPKITFTTTGTSGAATYNTTTGALNIPNYTGLTNITGLVTQGSGVTITGSGTSASPYVINTSATFTGSGTTNEIAYFSGTNNVTSSPKLKVTGNTTFPNLYLIGSSDTNIFSFSESTDNTGSAGITTNVNNGNGYFELRTYGTSAAGTIYTGANRAGNTSLIGNKDIIILPNITEGSLHLGANWAKISTSLFRISTPTTIDVLSGTGTRMVVASSTGVLSTQTILGSSGTVSSSNITIDANIENYIFSGTTATWTAPVITGNTWKRYFIKNRGSGNLIINSNGGANDFYLNSAINTLTLAPGEAILLVNDGTYLNIE